MAKDGVMRVMPIMPPMTLASDTIRKVLVAGVEPMDDGNIAIHGYGEHGEVKYQWRAWIDPKHKTGWSITIENASLRKPKKYQGEGFNLSTEVATASMLVR
jgi:hypothetical protein